jgi:multisubunit Na+/H+ antiporter MnhB subunit
MILVIIIAVIILIILGFIYLPKYDIVDILKAYGYIIIGILFMMLLTYMLEHD